MSPSVPRPAIPAEVKALLEGGVDAAVILDEERRILYYNGAYQTASGKRGRSLEKDAGASWSAWRLRGMAT